MNRFSIPALIASGQFPFFRLPALDDTTPTQAAIFGIPFDTGTTYRPGARFGPYAVRRASVSLGSVTSCESDVFATLQVADGGNLVCTPFSLPTALAEIEHQAVQIYDRNLIPIFVGGDHSCTFALLAAASRRHGPLSIVHFDAHTDTAAGDEWDGFAHHGTVFRKAIEAGYVAKSNFVQVGLRAPYGHIQPHAFTHQFGGKVFEADHIAEAIEYLKSLSQRWQNEPVYVSIDIDVLDPAYAPGTGTPVSGGLTTREMRQALRALRGLRIVGMDVMEVAPAYDHADITALAAAHLLFEGIALLIHQVN